MKKIISIILIILSFTFIKNVYAQESPSIEYQSHVQYRGWMSKVQNGELSGTTGQSLRLEAMKINLKNLDGSIEYQTHVQYRGWMNWVKNGEVSGTTGQSLRLEAIRIKLSDNLSKNYDIYYRTHVQYRGWMSWVKNGEVSGTTGQSLRLEAIEIKLVDKNAEPNITYKSYVNGDGWQNSVNNGETSGTTGQGKPISKINISLGNYDINKGNIYYSIYSNDKWSNYLSSTNDLVSNTNIEAIKIKLTGELEKKYDIYYRVHVQYFGWLGWAKNDTIAGSIGYFRQVEAVEIKLLKNEDSNITVGNSYKESLNSIEYRSHVQNIGWQGYVKDGELSGTEGKSLRLEAFKVKINSNLANSINYQAYVQDKGWQSIVSNDSLSGTEGQSKKLEAITINLTGELSNYYDVYYRTHVSYIGWLGWAKNGAKSGSVGSDSSIEAIQVKLVRKGAEAPGSTSRQYVTGVWSGNEYKDYFGNKATDFKFIDGIKYYFNSEGTMIGKNVKKVVDVSSWQGKIDWQKVKNAGIDAAIIRVGWGMSYNDEAGTDSYFDYNIKEVQRLGIPYSIYIYAYAKADYAAVKEANFVINKMKQYNIPKSTFVWYDAEINSIPLSTYNIVIPKFIDTMHANGYNNVGVYGSLNPFISSNGNLNSSKIRSYPLWVAQYYKKIQYPGSYKGWQYTSDGSVDGINGRVDLSMFY